MANYKRDSDGAPLSKTLDLNLNSYRSMDSSNCKNKVRLCSKWPMGKSCRIKGAAKKWLWWYRLKAKILITIIQVNIELIPVKRQQKLTWIVVIKFLPSTYTITAISWPPPLILQLFHTGHFKQGCTFFYNQAVFEQIAFTNITTQFLKK